MEEFFLFPKMKTSQIIVIASAIVACVFFMAQCQRDNDRYYTENLQSRAK